MSVLFHESEHLRKDYQLGSLSIEDVANHPIQQFQRWFDDALAAQLLEPNAMTLATISKENIPAARIVLMKGFDENGLLFYTNYESDKAEDIAHHPDVALVFDWKQMERQVRIQGRAEKLSDEQSDSHYNKRPRGSRIGAWTSPQSQTIASREVLENKLSEMTAKFENEEHIPRPPFWGGYRVVPSKVEFWQGRSSRLHDRIVFELLDDTWNIKRVAP